MTMAKRFNEGKPKMELIDPQFLRGMARVLQMGEDKYGRANWMQGLTYENILGSLSRHLEMIKSGEDKDEESGELHAYHIACNAMMLAWMMSNRSDLDDRRFKGKNPASTGNGRVRVPDVSQSPADFDSADVETGTVGLPVHELPNQIQKHAESGKEDPGPREAVQGVLFHDEIGELQERIARWASKVFPFRRGDDALRKLMIDELPELLHGGLNDPMEYADVLILVLDIAYLNGIDAVQAAHKKMDINEKRKWAVKPNGLLQHVEGGE